LEETENYPYAPMEEMKYKQIDVKLRDTIDKDVQGCTDAITERFTYIQQKYGSKRLTAENLTEGKSLNVINAILQESREYRTMRQQNIDQTDLSAYKTSLTKEIETDSQFASLSAFYQSSPRACYTIYQMTKPEKKFDEETKKEIEEDSYLNSLKDTPNYEQIKKNVQYFRKFILYQTL
jgi:hypothetical protein